MKLSCSIVIHSTWDKVWYWLGDPERAMVWQTNVAKTEVLHQTPDMIGTTFKETIAESGRGVEMQGVVTDYQDGRLLAMRLSGKYNEVDVEWRLEELGEDTRLTQNSDIRFKSFIKLLSLFIGPVFRNKITAQLQSEMNRLKQICEAND